MGTMAKPRAGIVLETALCVADLPRSIEFYERVLRFSSASDPWYERMCALNVTKDHVLPLFKKGGLVAPTVTPYGMIPPTNGDGSLHVAFAIPPADIEVWQQWLIESDIALESLIAWPEGGHSLYFRDPDDRVIGLKTSNWHGKELDW